MKHKKILILFSFVIILLTFVGVGVTAMMQKQWREKIGESSDGWDYANSLIETFGEQAQLQKNQLTAYDYETFRLYYGARNIVINASSQLNTLQQFNHVFPIELVKKIDSEHICIIYKLQRNNTENVFAYVIFERNLAYFSKNDGVEKAGNYELWKKTGELYFIDQELRYDSYTDVKEGDSAISVCTIDPAVSFDADYTISNATHIQFTSYRILSDGIMLIEFEAPKNQETGETPPLSAFTVAAKTFYPYHCDTTPKEIATIINSPELLK